MNKVAEVRDATANMESITCLSSLVVSFVGSSYSIITICNVSRNLMNPVISVLLESCS